jgi:hypothetical protein
VTRLNKSPAFTVEKLAHDCLDVRELRRKGLFSGDWVSFRPMLRWPAIALVRVVRYAILLDLRGHTLPQRIRVSWARVHFGGERPWMHCPHCETRVAKLYKGLGGYFCRRCVGNPIYASQALSAEGSTTFPGRQAAAEAGRRGVPNCAAP